MKVVAARATAEAEAKAATACTSSLCAVQLVAKVYDINPHPHWEIFLTLLCFLFSLHLYWCALTCSFLWSTNYRTRFWSLCILGLAAHAA